MKQIILASQSPRRKELLSQMGVEYQIIPSQFDEKLDGSRDPREVAKELALGKALDVANKYPDAYVIGADSITVVGVENAQLGKPADIHEARAMLKRLSGEANAVTCGVAIVNKNKGIELVDEDTAYVHFKPYDEATVEMYLQTGDYRDKAGGYGIQSGAAPLVERIEGDYDTIVGLPTRLLAQRLAEVGITAEAVTLEAPVKQEPLGRTPLAPGE